MKTESRIILITGASSGIGFEAARLLARQGHRVYGAARRVALMEPLQADGVTPLHMDVTDETSVRDGVQAVLDAEGRIDVLVNNAGYGYFGAIENVSLEEARRQMEVNVFGLACLTRAVLPAMRERGSGRIVNVASVAGKMNLYFGGWYHVSKFAVEAFSDALRMEVRPFGIEVSIIEPGGIKTDWGLIAADHLQESSQGTPYQEEAFREAHNLRKAYSSDLLSKPAVIARAISRAVNSRRPRTRYRIGFGAGPLVFFHAVLPDRWWDALMRMAGRITI